MNAAKFGCYERMAKSDDMDELCNYKLKSSNICSEI